MRLASKSSNEPDKSSANTPSKAQSSSPSKDQLNTLIPKPKVDPSTANSTANSPIGSSTPGNLGAVDPFYTTGMGLPPVNDGYAASNSGQYSDSGSSTYFGSGSGIAKRTSTDIKAFAKKLAIIVGIIAVAILISLPLTYVSNSLLCLIPILLVILGCLGLAFWARIWFIVLGFSQSQSQGLMVLFVPYYWLFFLSKNKQKCIKPLLVFGASLVPGLLGVMVTTFFKPDFVGASSRTDLRLTSAQQAQAR